MEIPDTVVVYIQKLVPSSIFEEIVAFRIVPIFPKSTDKCDIIVSTKRGELIEIKNRTVLRSCMLEEKSEEILLHYNGAGSLNYVVRTKSKVILVGRDGDDLKVINTFDGIARVTVDDETVSGNARINLWYLDSLMPVLLNDAYDEQDYFIADSGPGTENGDEKIVSILTGKLSEARLNTASNLKILREKREFRHQISHVSIEDSRHDIEDIEESEDDPVFDKIIIGKIWQRIHDEKWIIGIPLENASNRDINDVEVLLKYENDDVFNYTTSVYTLDETTPLFWTKSQYPISPKARVTVVAIADSPTFKLSSIVKCKCAINYKYVERFYCVTAPVIEINAVNLVNGNLSPILCSDNNFGYDDVLSLLAVSVATQFTMHFISSPEIAIMTFLQDKLGYVNGFDKLGNVLRHNGSFLHILHGTVINVVYKSIDNKFKADFTIITRSHNQLLMFINLLYDLFPSRIAIVPLSYDVESKKKVVSNSEDIMDFEFSPEIQDTLHNDKIRRYGSILHEQMSHVCDYLQNCIDDMSNCNIQKKPNNSSMNINVLCLGKELYEEFWDKLIKYDSFKNELLKDVL